MNSQMIALSGRLCSIVWTIGGCLTILGSHSYVIDDDETDVHFLPVILPIAMSTLRTSDVVPVQDVLADESPHA